METLLAFSVFMAFVVNTVYFIIHEEDMILHWFEPILYRLPWFIASPIGACVACMPSLWCTVGFLVLGWPILTIQLPAVIIATSSMAAIVGMVIQILKHLLKFFENDTDASC